MLLSRFRRCSVLGLALRMRRRRGPLLPRLRLRLLVLRSWSRPFLLLRALHRCRPLFLRGMLRLR